MTEAEWLKCADPQPMLEFLLGKATKRKECLFGVGCCQRVAHLFNGRTFWTLSDGKPYLPQPSRFLEMTECIAEKPTFLYFGEYDQDFPDGYSDEGHASFAADAALYSLNAERASTYASWAASVASGGYQEHYGLAEEIVTNLPGYAMERAAQCALLRDIFGNPFRPTTLDSSWLNPAVKALAQIIYDDRTFDQMPILANSFVKSGCADPEILNHLRGSGPHVRGCWVVDLVLGRE